MKQGRDKRKPFWNESFKENNDIVDMIDGQLVTGQI